MKKKLLILTFLILCQFSYAQESLGNSEQIPKQLSEQEFSKAKELFLKLTQTKAYKAQREAGFTFYRRFPRGTNWEYLLTDEDFAKWISENRRLTTFKTNEEAINMRKALIDTKTKFVDDNAEFYDLVKKANSNQLKVIFASELRPVEVQP